jgi:hypothetical protein
VKVTTEESLMERSIEYNRVLGGFIGLALGDALGIPHEFASMGNPVYTGKIEYRLRFRRQYQPTVELGLGQVSDDTEMSLALARSLVKEGEWNRDAVVVAYLDWANNSCMVGRNTRALFKGVKTYRGYSSRYEKVFGISPESGETVEGASQSNGSLMRAFPLACVSRGEMSDAMLTNPSELNVAINMIYVGVVRLALRGVSPQEIWTSVSVLRSPFPEISRALDAADKAEDWEMANTPEKKQKGWVLFGFYSAMYCLCRMRHGYDKDTYAYLMSWVIGRHPGSDTDTNAAISGALIGAIVGWDLMRQDPVTVENYRLARTMTATDVPRPPEYRIDDIEGLCRALTDLTRSAAD